MVIDFGRVPYLLTLFQSFGVQSGFFNFLPSAVLRRMSAFVYVCLSLTATIFLGIVGDYQQYRERAFASTRPVTGEL